MGRQGDMVRIRGMGRQGDGILVTITMIMVTKFDVASGWLRGSRMCSKSGVEIPA